MNKLTVFGIYILFGFCANAQTVVVKSQDQTIGSESVAGYATNLEGSKETVLNAWIKYLKDFGKVRQSDHVTIADPTFGGNTAKGTVHSVIADNDGKTTVWLGILKGDWSDAARMNKELEKILHEFGIKFYQEKIQFQIDETQQASDAVKRQAQRTMVQGKNLETSLNNNIKQRAVLEKSLEENKLENAALLIKIANNKKAQDSLANASNQIQKVQLSHQERQKKVQ